MVPRPETAWPTGGGLAAHPTPAYRHGLFEAYNKSLALLPTGELPWYRTSLGVNAPRILAEHAEVAERVLERIRAEGPLSTAGCHHAWSGHPPAVRGAT